MPEVTDEPLEFSNLKKVENIIPDMPIKEAYKTAEKITDEHYVSNILPSQLPETESMVATAPATVVYAISASKMQEWRKIRKLMTFMFAILIIFVILGFIWFIISWQHIANVLEVGIRVRSVV